MPLQKSAGGVPPGTSAPAEKPISSTPVKPPSQPYALLHPAHWAEMPGLAQEDWLASWPAWLQSCQGLKKKTEWQAVCATAQTVKADDAVAIQTYWQQNFNVYSTQQLDGVQQGLITGYYQPVLKGARMASERYPVPLYKVPTDLITVNLSSLFPDLKYKRVRGRVQGQTLVPYYTRAEIEQQQSPLAGNELLWVGDAVEAFFLQVQGSGIVELENGERLPVGYADQNGHPYQSIGKLLVERGEMQASEASMQGIKNWGQQHPEQLQGLLNANPSYVFFKLLPAGLSGPLGALGVPLTGVRSIAVDPFYIPLGAPVYLATTYPNSDNPLQQLMVAQDTGGAIKGGVRADVYWGEGESAGKLAGAMRQQGQLWVWLPKNFQLPQP
ncbi:membrane-bound lytic murein transglycosylase A [Methylophilus rhizosphaerae]|uniref:peptidoglycan lytic exotransglycosylase n=1 Tax=Methylophilus rhizosphaerae TaxID=492660 RepID=A0A1G9CF31_9PROT|nr:membrane-bound lytic murein transglycosylase A [Methylophilus rhizosphaerae]